MARTIGRKWKKKVKELVKSAQNECGLNGISEIQAYVHEALPDEAYDTWEASYDEINRIVDDLVMEGMYGR